MTDKYKQLSEKFPDNVEAQVRKGSANLTYIPYAEVVSRANHVLGYDRWSSEIVRVWRDETDPDFVLAHVRVSVQNDDGTFVRRDAMGGQKCNRKSTGDLIDLGDDFKGATSDALKKALQQLGIGLYLARDDAALALEAQEDAIADADPAKLELFNNMMKFVEGFNDGQKSALGEYWKSVSNGAPKPTISTVDDYSEETLKGLVTECIKISTGATTVSEMDGGS